MTKQKTIAVFGGSGFFGSHIIDYLRQYTNTHILSPTHQQCDLIKPRDIYEYIFDNHPHIIINAAALSGGIIFNHEHQYDLYHENIRISTNLLDAIYLDGLNISKVVNIISSCAYPDLQDKVLEVEDFWNGLPNESVRFFGLQKRHLVAMSMSINADKARDIQCICPIVNNLYGPRDTFDLAKTKVVGAVIRKIHTAKKQKLPNVTFFGTGSPTRQFTYVKDAAGYIANIAMGNENRLLFNITSPIEDSIQYLVEQVARILDYKGQILWDQTKPDGQMRKSMNPDYYCDTSLEEGLEETIQWYLENYS